MSHECTTNGCEIRPPAGEDLCLMCGMKKQLQINTEHSLKLEERIKALTAERDDLACELIEIRGVVPENVRYGFIRCDCGEQVGPCVLPKVWVCPKCGRRL